MGQKLTFYAMKSKYMSKKKYQKLKTNQLIAFFKEQQGIFFCLKNIIAKATLQLTSNSAWQLQTITQRQAYFSK